ncbi:hypothetical protein [Natronomonas sp. EA1]|uniref:hypothetical protein n=1 Tax=Natronomonas sp. EA1 TaxID=3421655 RepID=UPI003EB98A19
MNRHAERQPIERVRMGLDRPSTSGRVRGPPPRPTVATGLAVREPGETPPVTTDEQGAE